MKKPPTTLFLALLSVLMLFLSNPLPGQETEHAAASEEQHGESEITHQRHHAIGLGIGHVSIREAVVEGSVRWLSLPSFHFNYNYHFHPRWAIGLHTDLIIEEFSVEKHLEGDHQGEAIERNRPIAPAVVATYKFGKRPYSSWGLAFGAGAEFASGESFFLNRLEIEYGVEVRNHWEVYAGFGYDIKWNAYDSFAISVGVAKALGLPHEEGPEHH